MGQVFENSPKESPDLPTRTILVSLGHGNVDDDTLLTKRKVSHLKSDELGSPECSCETDIYFNLTGPR
jgi:hypothetical protein